MKKIFVDEMITWVAQAKAELEAHDIACFIKNEFAVSAAGEVPFIETWPELWIHNDHDLQRANVLLEPLIKKPPAGQQ